MDWVRAKELKLNPDNKREDLFSGPNLILESGITSMLDKIALPLKAHVATWRVFLDLALLMDVQVVAVARNACYLSRLVPQLCLFLIEKDLATVMHGLIISRLHYCNALYLKLPFKRYRNFTW